MASVVVLTTSGSCFGGTLLVNSDFETGALLPWFQGRNFCPGFQNAPCENWSVTSADSHSGKFSATDVGNIELRQNINPTAANLISQVSYWIKHPDGVQLSVDVIFFYSDGTTDERTTIHGLPQFTTDANWTFFDWTSDLQQSKILTGISLFGFDRSPALTDRTFVDDFTVNVVPEPVTPLLFGSGLLAFLFAGVFMRRHAQHAAFPMGYGVTCSWRTIGDVCGNAFPPDAH